MPKPSKQPHPANPDRLVALLRVSDVKQEQSGLGIMAQRTAVANLAAVLGATVVREFQETESGGHDDPDERPVLLKAVMTAKRLKATLVLAKTDRLIRSIPMLAFLKTCGVPFLAADNPTQNEFTTDILAAVAAQERRAISARTKAALSEYRAHRRLPNRIRKLYAEGIPPEVEREYADRAGKLGAELPECRNLRHEDRVKGAQIAGERSAAAAVEYAREILDEIESLGLASASLRAIAAGLNAAGVTARNGGEWSASLVKRVMDRRADAIARVAMGRRAPLAPTV